MHRTHTKHRSTRLSFLILYCAAFTGCAGTETFRKVSSSQGDSTIQAVALGRPLVIRTTARLAGAIGSLTWNGKEFINQDDHGRELQSASSFDGFGECFNPTEAGSSADGTGPTSSSRLLQISATQNQLSTSTQMAFWTRPDQSYPNGCGGNPKVKVAQNRTVLSNHTLFKNVKIGFMGISNVIEHEITFRVPEHHQSASIEALTGYLGKEFRNFLTYDPLAGTITRASTGPAEDPRLTIFSTIDNQYAMGVFAANSLQADDTKVVYARYSFLSHNTMKWSAVFRRGDTPPKDYSYRVYVVVGSVTQVAQGLSALYRSFHREAPDFSRSQPVFSDQAPNGQQNIYRFFKAASGEHFLTSSYEEGLGAEFNYEGIAFRSFTPGSRPARANEIFRCFTNSRHFVSTSPSCEGTRNEGSLGFLSADPSNQSFPVYRFVGQGGRDHLTTKNQQEGTSAGYTLEGILGYAP